MRAQEPYKWCSAYWFVVFFELVLLPMPSTCETMHVFYNHGGVWPDITHASTARASIKMKSAITSDISRIRAWRACLSSDSCSARYLSMAGEMIYFIDFMMFWREKTILWRCVVSSLVLNVVRPFFMFYVQYSMPLWTVKSVPVEKMELLTMMCHLLHNPFFWNLRQTIQLPSIPWQYTPRNRAIQTWQCTPFFLLLIPIPDI